MRILILLCLVFALSSCGAVQHLGAWVGGSGLETCHDGVMYLQFSSGATVAYNKNGSIKLCDN